MSSIQSISFYKRFVQDILSGTKTITIRDDKAKQYKIDETVTAVIHPDNQSFATLKILSIESILFNQINEDHAQQENMELPELKQVIKEIYPGTNQFYVIGFRVIG